MRGSLARANPIVHVSALHPHGSSTAAPVRRGGERGGRAGTAVFHLRVQGSSEHGSRPPGPRGAPPAAIPQRPRRAARTSGAPWCSSKTGNDNVVIAPVCGAATAGWWMAARAPAPLAAPAPKYPPRLLARGIEGWVVTELTVAEGGSVANPKAVDAEPRDVFDVATLRAVSRYRFRRRSSPAGPRPCMASSCAWSSASPRQVAHSGVAAGTSPFSDRSSFAHIRPAFTGHHDG